MMRVTQNNQTGLPDPKLKIVVFIHENYSITKNILSSAALIGSAHSNAPEKKAYDIVNVIYVSVICH